MKKRELIRIFCRLIERLSDKPEEEIVHPGVNKVKFRQYDRLDYMSDKLDCIDITVEF